MSMPKSVKIVVHNMLVVAMRAKDTNSIKHIRSSIVGKYSYNDYLDCYRSEFSK